ncbi:MAG TPA: SRPBCC family protein [Solirubrobacteraceae bacterium]|jgi:hypothetical protein|nr:SRPBCC family protein [Solirubrobacteraceae bacterium]
MPTVEVKVETDIAAPAEKVIGALGDYTGVREKINPVAIKDFEVVEGGTGAGTRYTARLVARRERDLDMTATAPTPLTLEETDANSSLQTTYTVTERGAGASHVTIRTTWSGATGFSGLMERTFAPIGLKPIYQEMLERLSFAVVHGIKPRRPPPPGVS